MAHLTIRQLGVIVCMIVLSTLALITLYSAMSAKGNAVEQELPTSENHIATNYLKCNEPYEGYDYGPHCVKIDITDAFQKEPSTVVSTTEDNVITITVGITATMGDEIVDLYFWDKNQNKKLAALGIDQGCNAHLDCAWVITQTDSISITQLNQTFTDVDNPVYTEVTFSMKAKKPADTNVQTYSAWLCPEGSEGSDMCYGHGKGWVIVERPLLIFQKPIEIKIRAFIPCGAIDYLLDIFDPSQSTMFGGDGRSFSYDGGTSRIDRVVTVTTDPAQSPRISPPQGDLRVVTTQYSQDDGEPIPGRVYWCKNLKSGAKPETKDQLVPDTTKVSRENGEVKVNLNFNFGNPFAFGLYPNADADINVYVRQHSGTMPQYKIVGNHDGFPAYEIYIDKKLVYCHDPLETGDSPRSLGGLGSGEIEINKEWQDVVQIDCKPIFGVRFNSRLGKPGSFLVLTGNGFSANETLSFQANEVTLGTMIADSNGRFQATFDTQNADVGYYNIVVNRQILASTAPEQVNTLFLLKSDSFALPRDLNVETVIGVPAGIAIPPNLIHLPLVAK